MCSFLPPTPTDPLQTPFGALRLDKEKLKMVEWFSFFFSFHYFGVAHKLAAFENTLVYLPYSFPAL